MRNVISRLKGRLRHGLATQEFLDQLARRGFVVYPYIVFEELADSRFRYPSDLPALAVRRLTEEDCAEITAIAVRPQDVETVRNRFRRGDIGVGAFDAGKLVAYTWCNLEHFGGVGQKSPRRLLAGDEAYLYDAYTLPDYRGQALVPHLRTELYRLLQAEGRSRVYSVSLFFNRSARRFKAKLGASTVELRLSINLFEKFRRDVLIKRYDAPARAG